MYTKETPNLLERYSLAQKSGFQAVECAFPYAFTPEELVKVQVDSGLEQILLNTDPGTCLGFAALVNHEQKFMESLHKSIEYCQAVKCQRLHIMSGKMTENVTASTQVLKDNLKKALPLLEKAGIIGLIEPINPYWVPDYFLNDFDLAADIIKEINHPNLKLMLDVFHLQYLKGNLSNNIPKLLPITGHVQIAQVPTRHEPDSEGEKDYKYVLKLLEQEGYQGWIGLEYIPKAGTDQGLSWIQDFGYKL